MVLTGMKPGQRYSFSRAIGKERSCFVNGNFFRLLPCFQTLTSDLKYGEEKAELILESNLLFSILGFPVSLIIL